MPDLIEAINNILAGNRVKGHHAEWYVDGYPECIELTYEESNTQRFASYWFNITSSGDRYYNFS